MLELTVKLKSEDGERTYTHKHMVYEEITINGSNEDIQSYIKSAIKEFGEQPDSVIIQIRMTL